MGMEAQAPGPSYTAFPQHINGQLDQKQSSQCAFGMLALSQAAAFRTTPQCWPILLLSRNTASMLHIGFVSIGEQDCLLTSCNCIIYEKSVCIPLFPHFKAHVMARCGGSTD